jgi:hypothetical protein
VTTPDPAAALEEIRERAESASTYDEWHQVGRDCRRLLAALEAVLDLAREWDESAARFDATASIHSDPVKKGRNRGIAAGLLACAAGVRETITRELSGEGG